MSATPLFTAPALRRVLVGTISRPLAVVVVSLAGNAAATVLVGGVNKPSIGTVNQLQAGDVACYVSLTDDQGRRYQESADFAFCEKPAQYLGKRVSLAYALASVMAPDCQGNPACKKTIRIPVIQSMTVLGAPVATAPQAAPPAARTGQQGQTSFCTPRETVVFACRTATRLVSVCASGDAGRNRGYLQYRFGKPDSAEPLELMLPEGEQLPSRAATGESVPLAGGGASWLRFRKGAFAYVTYAGVGRWGPGGQTDFKQGVVVERDGKMIANLKCAKEPLGELGPDWFEKTGVTLRAQETFDLPD